jgi:putative zinc finger/helix-turn-helix YgiT family protein
MRPTRKPYPYRESGLENVILTGIRVWQCPSGHQQPEIPNIEGLHRLIAKLLTQSRTRLHGPEIRYLRKFLGYAAKDFAKLLGVTPVTVSRWENGAEEIGAPSERLIRTLASFVANESARRDPQVVLHALMGLLPAGKPHAIRIRRASKGDDALGWVAA